MDYVLVDVRVIERPDKTVDLAGVESLNTKVSLRDPKVPSGSEDDKKSDPRCGPRRGRRLGSEFCPLSPGAGRCGRDCRRRQLLAHAGHAQHAGDCGRARPTATATN